jgi:hypothetical protein
MTFVKMAYNRMAFGRMAFGETPSEQLSQHQKINLFYHFMLSWTNGKNQF